MVPNPLGRVGLFRGVSLEGMNAIANAAAQRTFEPGQVLLQQGDIGRSMHVLLQGLVRVERSHPELREPIELARLTAGEVVGEIGVLDGLPRTATVVALDHTETLEIDRDTLADAMLRYPSAAIALLRTVSGRLRHTDELTEWLLRRREEHHTEERQA